MKQIFFGFLYILYIPNIFCQTASDIVNASSAKLGYSSLVDIGVIQYRILQSNNLTIDQEIVFTASSNGDLRADVQLEDGQVSFIKNSKGYFQVISGQTMPLTSEQTIQNLERFNFLDNFYTLWGFSDNVKLGKSNGFIVIQSKDRSKKLSVKIDEDTLLPMVIEEDVSGYGKRFQRTIEFREYKEFAGLWIATEQTLTTRGKDNDTDLSEVIRIRDLVVANHIKPSFFYVN
ncbi:hypothetical protein [Roseivirga thermotolerans]|uniref:hypothetical protein n=1 Tax=Roseivirga thermotolerans TaxID=1758176 RepID=UPI00273F0D1A|nr:hypothetical protein [Roseivirga thermotolerans]